MVADARPDRTACPRGRCERPDGGAYRRGRASRPRSGLLLRGHTTRKACAALGGCQGLYGRRAAVHDPQGGALGRARVGAAARGRHGGHTGRRRRDIRRAAPRTYMSREGYGRGVAGRAPHSSSHGHPDQRHDALRPCRDDRTACRPSRPPAPLAGRGSGLRRVHSAEIPQPPQPPLGGRRVQRRGGSADDSHVSYIPRQHSAYQGLLGRIRQADGRAGALVRCRRSRRHDRRLDQDLLHGRGRRASVDERSADRSRDSLGGHAPRRARYALPACRGETAA